MSKRQLARHPEINRSVRWVEQRVAEGMPSQMKRGRRVFALGEALAWLDERQHARVADHAAPPQAESATAWERAEIAERVAKLERRIAALEAGKDEGAPGPEPAA